MSPAVAHSLSVRPETRTRDSDELSFEPDVCSSEQRGELLGRQLER